MSSDISSETTVSENEQPTTEQRTADPAARTQCAECEGRIITKDQESYCEACGLVVSSTSPLEHEPTLMDRGPDERGPSSWQIHPTSGLMFDNGLGSTFNLDEDGYGNPLSDTQDDRFYRLKRRQKRFGVPGNRKRSKRLGDCFHEIKLLGSELALPIYVKEDAAQWMRMAKEARLPGGKMAWESLAAGAVWLAAERAGLRRDFEEVVTYAKTNPPRLVAAARKIRVELGLDAPPVREGLVVEILDELPEDTFAERDAIEELAQDLLALADTEAVGSGTTRVTVAAAAIYTADRLTDGKAVTYEVIAAAAEPIGDTSKWRITTYARDLHDAYQATYGDSNPRVVLNRDLALGQ